MAKGGPEDTRATELCADAMQSAAFVAGEVVGQTAPLDRRVLSEMRPIAQGWAGADLAVDAPAPLVRLEKSAKSLSELRLVHRSATLGKVATGELTADEAMVRVDTVARYEALARHAWRSAAHLVGRGE